MRVRPAPSSPLYPKLRFAFTARGQHPRSAGARARRVLRDGSRVPRLRAPAPLSRGRQLLCHPWQIESQSATSVLARRRPRHRTALRSDRRPHGLFFAQRLRGSTATHSVQESRNRQDLGFSHQQLHVASLHNHRRWQVALFFKWMKQHLQIKAVFGTSENTVKSQIWIAVSVYVLVAIVKKRLKLSTTLYEMLQILSLTIFERIPLDQLPAQAVREGADHIADKQLILFE